MEIGHIAALVVLAAIIALTSMLIGLLLKEMAYQKAVDAAIKEANKDYMRLQDIEREIRSMEVKRKQGRQWSRIDDEDFAQLIHARNRLQIRIRNREQQEQAQLLAA